MINEFLKANIIIMKWVGTLVDDAIWEIKW